MLKRNESGFALVELLVAIVIAGVVGGVVLTSLVSGMRASSDAQDRIDAFNELQVALERMSRELRAADPIEIATGDEVRVRTFRDGACTEYTFTRTGTSLDVTRRPLGDMSCSAPGTATTTQLLDGIMNAEADPPVFQFFTADGVATTALSDIDVIELTLRKSVGQQPSVVVATVVHVRNSG